MDFAKQHESNANKYKQLTKQRTFFARSSICAEKNILNYDEASYNNLKKFSKTRDKVRQNLFNLSRN